MDNILKESRLTKLLESSKCIDGSSAFIRGTKGRIDHSYVTVKFVPCFLESDPGVECAPTQDIAYTRSPIEGYAIVKKVMLSDKEDSLQNRMIKFDVESGAQDFLLATNSLTLEEDMVGFITS